MAEAKYTRPIGIYFLEILILWIAGWNGLRLGESVLFWKTLRIYGGSSIYIALSGGVWLIIGLFLLWSLWLGKGRGNIVAIFATAGYIFWYWLDRLFLQEPHANWPFVLISQIIFLLIIFSILFSKGTKRFFKREADERKPETPKLA